MSLFISVESDEQGNVHVDSVGGSVLGKNFDNGSAAVVVVHDNVAVLALPAPLSIESAVTLVQGLGELQVKLQALLNAEVVNQLSSLRSGPSEPAESA